MGKSDQKRRHSSELRSLLCGDGRPIRGPVFHDHIATGRVALSGLARLAGIEPTTLGFGGQYSIH